MTEKNEYYNMTEKEWDGQIRDMCRRFGWRYYHTYRSKRSPQGFPDLVLVRPPRVVFAELKRDTTKLTPFQEEWMTDLKRCSGVEAYIWCPSDFYEVAEILR